MENPAFLAALGGLVIAGTVLFVGIGSVARSVRLGRRISDRSLITTEVGMILLSVAMPVTTFVTPGLSAPSSGGVFGGTVILLIATVYLEMHRRRRVVEERRKKP